MLKISPKNWIIIQSVKVELFSELFVSILIFGWFGYDHEHLRYANMQLYFEFIIWF